MPSEKLTEQRRANVKKASAVRKQRAAARREAKAAGRPDPYPTLRMPAGKKWSFDEVATAVLEADDAVESRRIIQAMSHKASLGNVQAAQFLVERALGKPVQKVQLSGGLSLETLDQALPGVPEVASGDPTSVD